MDRRCEFGKTLVHVTAPGDEPGLIVAYIRHRPESVHLQFEDVVLVVEWFKPKDQVCRCELREGESDFSVAEGSSCTFCGREPKTFAKSDPL